MKNLWIEKINCVIDFKDFLTFICKLHLWVNKKIQDPKFKVDKGCDKQFTKEAQRLINTWNYADVANNISLNIDLKQQWDSSLAHQITEDQADGWCSA